MRSKNSITIAVRLTPEHLQKLNSTGIRNKSEVIRRCIDKTSILDLTPYKRGRKLIAKDTFEWEETGKNVLIIGKEYVIKHIDEYEGELCLVIESEVCDKHNFEGIDIQEYFNLI